MSKINTPDQIPYRKWRPTPQRVWLHQEAGTAVRLSELSAGAA